MRKIIKLCYILCFLMLLLAPTFCVNRKENAVSEIDNRNLTEAPEFGQTGFTTNLEAYFEDRIGFRSEMINAYALLNDRIANELTHPTYTYGKNGYIFFRMKNNQEFDDYKRTFAEMVYQVQQYCTERGAEFYFMFEPEKSSVYRAYLPNGVTYSDQWAKDMLEYMKELGVNCIDNTELLVNKSEEEQVFNRKYDAGHWNDLGCFYATNHLLERIHSDHPAVTALRMDEFKVTQKLERYLPSSNFLVNEMVPSFQLKQSYRDITSEYVDQIKVNKQFPHFHYYINDAENANMLPKMLVFQGSYYNRGPQFLVSRTSEYIGVHNYQNILDVDYYFNIFQPDVVVFEIAEYTVSNTYFDYQGMLNLDLNSSLISRKNQEQSLEKLLKKTERVDVNGKAVLVQDGSVDRVYIDKPFSDARYAYIIADGKVYDMRRTASGKLAVELMGGALDGMSRIAVYLQEKDGTCYYSWFPLEQTKRLNDKTVLSENTQCSETNEFILNTPVRKNKFNQVNLQLLDADGSEYYTTITNTDGNGIMQDAYVHDMNTGWYTVRLKVNSNLADEFLDNRIWLEKGKTYYYSFNVKKLTNKQVIVSGFNLYG